MNRYILYVSKEPLEDELSIEDTIMIARPYIKFGCATYDVVWQTNADLQAIVAYYGMERVPDIDEHRLTRAMERRVGATALLAQNDERWLYLVRIDNLGNQARAKMNREATHGRIW